MSQVLNLSPPTPNAGYSTCLSGPDSRSWTFLQQRLKCNGRVRCLFSDNHRQEQARKALEGALSGKKNEFEKWNKEIKRREEAGDGGNGRGGWFGSGGWFGWSNGDHFWREAKQMSLTVLGIVFMYLIIAKGNVLLAVVLNPLLCALRGTRNGFSFITSKVLRRSSTESQVEFDYVSKKKDHGRVSAKENVIRKWGSE